MNSEEMEELRLKIAQEMEDQRRRNWNTFAWAFGVFLLFGWLFS